MTTKEKMKLLEKLGWCEYYGNSCYKQEWADNGKPYDRMAQPIDVIYEQVIDILKRDRYKVIENSCYGIYKNSDFEFYEVNNENA